MVSIRLKFRPSVNDGKEGSLYYQVIYNRVVRQVATQYKIFPNEWDDEVENIIVKPPAVRCNYLESIKQTVRNDTNRFYRIEQELARTNSLYTVDDIVDEYRKQSNGSTLFSYMEQMIARYWRQGQLRTSETYSTTLNSFKRFRADIDVYLEDIDSELMEAYENHLKQNDLSPNTISFYMKHLRAVYKRAVDDELLRDKNPFKRVSTSIEKTAKRAISLKVLKRLKAMDLSDNSSKRFARDIFLFSFYTRGMSFVDIAYLQKKNLKGDVLSYRRRKTNQPLKIGWEPDM